METAELISRLKSAVPGALLQRSPFGRTEQPSLWIELGAVARVAEFLRSEPALKLDWAENVSVAQFDETLVVTYFLRSTSTGQSLILRGSLAPESVDAKVPLPTVTPVWPMARRHEVEAAELFGIEFTGLPKGKNEVLPADWVGFPLRKGYSFPLEHAGIEHRRTLPS